MLRNRTAITFFFDLIHPLKVKKYCHIYDTHKNYLDYAHLKKIFVYY